MKPDALAARRLAAGGEHLILVLGAKAFRGARRVAVEQPRHLRREQHFRARRRPPRRSPARAPAHSPPDRFRSFDWKSAMRVIRRNQIVEPAVAIERHEIVAPADMMLANENLRHGRPPVGALDHLLAHLAAEIDRNLPILDALRFEQRLRPPAIRAEGLGIDFDRHGTAPSSLILRHAAQRINWEGFTTRAQLTSSTRAAPARFRTSARRPRRCFRWSARRRPG